MAAPMPRVPPVTSASWPRKEISTLASAPRRRELGRGRRGAGAREPARIGAVDAVHRLHRCERRGAVAYAHWPLRRDAVDEVRDLLAPRAVVDVGRGVLRGQAVRL